jgi:hypothetical protein
MASRSTTTATFQFVDSHPARGSKRDQELIRAEARSHAAKVAYLRSQTRLGQQDEGTSDPQTLPSAPVKTKAEPKAGSKALATRARYNQKDAPFNRFRVDLSKSAKGGAQAVEPSPEDVKERRSSDDSVQAMVSKMFVPMIGGNSDPFDATVIRLSPVEHVLLQQSRDQLITSVWASEIMIRHNKSAITTSSWKIAPPTLHNEASNYALVSQAYFSRASRQRVAGLPADKGLVQGEKYKFQALRRLQEQLEVNRQSPGDRQRLRGIFLACCWLAGIELLCQNWAAAESKWYLWLPRQRQC